MGNNKNPHNNQSGLPDPTAYEALKPIIKKESDIEKKCNFFN